MRTHWHSGKARYRGAARLAVGGGRDFRGGEHRRLGPGARSAPPLLTRGVLSERRARSAQSELRRAVRVEEHSGVGVSAPTAKAGAPAAHCQP